jgi:hypothetical protein
MLLDWWLCCYCLFASIPDTCMCSVYHACMYVCMHACMPYMSVPPVQILVTTNFEKFEFHSQHFFTHLNPSARANQNWEPLVNGLMYFVIDCNTFTSPRLTCRLTSKLSNWSLLFISDTCPDGVRLDRNPLVAKHCLWRSALATDRGAGRLAGPRRVVKAGRGRGGCSTESGAYATLSVEHPRGDSSGRPPPRWFESGNVCRPNRQKGRESAIEATHSIFV